MILQKLIFSRHLDKREEVLYAVHRHWIAIFKPVLEVAFFGFLIPWGLYAIGFNTSFFFWIAVVWSGLAYLRFLYLLLDWYADVWLLTNQAVIVISWRGFFSNQSSRVGWEDIEGVAYEVNGFFATVLGYGRMVLKVMSGSNYEIIAVRSPKKVELAFAHLQDQYIKDRQGQDATHLKALLSEMVARHVRKS